MRASRLKSTAFYEYVNVNPKGRLSGDCVIRAVALMTEQSWERTVRDLTELGISKGYLCNDPDLFKFYLPSKGFEKLGEPRDENNKKMSVREYIRRHPEREFVACVGSHHVSCVKDGKVRDIWDCSGETLHTIWLKKR